MTRISRLVLGVLSLVAWTLPFGAAPAAPSAVSAIPQTSASWTWCGWGGGGFFWTCAFDPANANTLYVGGDVNGFCKSTDQGRTWHFINRGLQNYGAFGLAVASSQPSTLYAMTCDGMARSENGGETWKPLDATRKGTGTLNLSANKPGSVRPIAVDPRDSQTVYAGSIGGVLARSTDGGQTWAPLDYLSALAQEPHAVAPKLPPPPSGTNFLWLAVNAPANDWDHHGRAEKFLSAAGENWSAYGRLTASVFAPADAPPLQVQLVIQSGAGWLWQPGPNVTPAPGRWSEVTLDLAPLKDLQAVHIVYIVVRTSGAAWKGDLGLDAVTLHPAAADGKTRLLGDWEKPGSTEEWKAGSHTADAPFIAALRNAAATGVDPKAAIATVVVADADPKLVLAAHRTLGLFRSADAGATWRRVWTGSASAVSIAPSDPKIAYAALGKNGVWTSTDGGLTWAPTGTAITNKCDVRDVVVDPRNPAVAHAIGSYDWGGYSYHTTNGGATWTCVRTFARDLAANPTLPDETGSGLYAKSIGGMSTLSDIALAPSAPQTLFIAANWNNILSTDGGATWSERIHGADITCIQDITFCGSNTYAAAMDEGLLVSADRGASWRQLTPGKYTAGLSGHQWRVLAWKAGDQEHILSTVSPWRAAQIYPNYALVSADGGKHFTRGTQGLPDYLSTANCMWGQSYPRALAADPKDPNTFYLGMDGDPEKGRMGGGIFKSTDGGITWTQLPHQPPSRRGFFGLAVDPTDSKRLYWSSVAGLARSDDGGDTWKSVLSGWIFNVHVTADGTVYSGDKDVKRSTDHGATWKTLSHLGSDATSLVGIASDPADAQRLWISLVSWDGSDRGGIYRTIDGGKSWQEITGDIGYRKPLVLRYNAETKDLWAGGVGLFRLAQ